MVPATSFSAVSASASRPIFSGRSDSRAGVPGAGCAAPRLHQPRRAGLQRHAVGAHLPHRAVQEVRLAEEVGDEAGARALVQRFRRAHLHQPAVVQDGDLVGERQRLLLVMRDVDEGAADAAVQRLQLVLQFGPQLLVERRERLVQQQQRRVEDQGAGQRHALLLAARKLRRPAFGEGGKLHQVERRAHLRVAVGAGQAADPQREGDVLRHRHVREQRIALEDHAEVAPLRRQGGDVAAIQQHARRRSARRSRRSPSGWWSCRCRTGRAASGTARDRRAARRHPPR